MLCLPKALVKDSVNNDVVTKPYQIATPWGSTEYSGGRGAYCVDGYKLLVAPATPEATRIANKAAMNLICSGPRSSYVDSWAGNFLKAIGCETWGGMDTPPGGPPGRIGSLSRDQRQLGSCRSRTLILASACCARWEEGTGPKE